MADRPLPRVERLRVWDIYAGAFMGVVLVNALVMRDQPWWHWLVPGTALAVWYVVLGRRAVVRHERGWAMTFAIGAVVLFAVGAWLDPWLAPLQGALIPVLWWLFWPSRRLGTIWTVVVALTSSLALGLFKLLGRDASDVWHVGKTVSYVAVLPAVVCGVGILTGWWVTSLYRSDQERRALVRDLRQTEAQRMELERAAAVADERLRLSQEVHDTIAQDLAGLRFLVERARRQADAAVSDPGLGEIPGEAESSRPLDQTLDMIASAVDTLHAESRDLISARAPVPAGSSFAEAVERIAGRFARETDITVETEVADVRLTREAEVVFVRCLQEGLSNVRKHAEATRVWLSVTASDDGAVMTLADDGVGLPADVPEGFGLPGMAERVRQAGGSFAVSSPGPHGGVGLRVRMPLPVGSG